MNEEDFKRRTKQLALRVIRLVEALPQSRTTDVIGKQLIRSATSVGANYRSACRGKSTADVIAKFSLVEEEADESLYWMELIVEIGLLPLEKVSNLMSENTEILAMTVASIKTLRHKEKTQNQKTKTQNPS
ncbi:four helix bundle protein [Nostoc sp. ATCC 43529]|nr:four helix bundle protein [Nostoc sp. ATCC 43529]